MPAIGGGGPFTNPPTNNTTVSRALLALTTTLAVAIGGVTYFSVSTSGANVVGALVATTNVTATAGDVTSGDDLLCGDDLTFSTSDPVLLSTGAGTVNLFNTVATAVNIAGGGDLVISGGSGSTGCTVTGATGDLACSGDLSAAGGFRQTLHLGALNNLQRSTAQGTEMVGMATAGSVVGIAVTLQGTDITAGSVACAITIDGTAITGHSLTLDATTPAVWRATSLTIAKGEHEFTASQAIAATCTPSADLEPDGTPDVYVAVAVEN